MNSTKWALRGLLASILAVCAAVSMAQINTPPWWNIDDGNTTSHGWNFDNPTAPLFDHVGLNPWGLPTFLQAGDVAYDANLGQFILRNGGEIGFEIPNQERREWIKLFWMQFVIKWDGDAGAWMQVPQGHQINNWHTTGLDDLGGGWFRWTLEGEILPQPAWERFGLYTGANGIMFVDSMYFGTHCIVPEPASLAVIGLGVVGVIARRRRKA